MSDFDVRGMGSTCNRVIAGDFWASNVAVPKVKGRASRAQAKRLQEAVIGRVGWDLFAELVSAARASPEFRTEIVDKIRHGWWVIRNARACEGQTVIDATHDVLFSQYVLEAAGVSVDTLRRMTACMSSGCVCDRCDLATGARAAGPLQTA